MSNLDDMTMAKQGWEDDKAAALKVAELQGLAAGYKNLTAEEEDLLFNKMAAGWTPDKEIAMYAEGKTRRQVGAAKFPHRIPLAKSGGRALSKLAQAKYIAARTRRTDPTWQPSVTEAQPPPLPPGLEPPPPDPMMTTQAPPTEAGLSFGG